MSFLPLTAADEVQIFTTVPFSERRGKGERRPSRGRETERAAALPASSTAAILCFFPVLPNMELQSCSVPHLRWFNRHKSCKVPLRVLEKKKRNYK